MTHVKHLAQAWHMSNVVEVLAVIMHIDLYSGELLHYHRCQAVAG